VDKKRFFVSDWLWENKKPFFIDLLWGKTSADCGGRTTWAWAERWTGWAQIRQRSVPIFYL